MDRKIDKVVAMTKNITLPDFLTSKQIKDCIRMHPDRLRIRDEVIVPNLDTINSKLGQENDADYLSWCVIYVMVQVTGIKA